MKTILNILACVLVYGSGAASGYMVARAYRNSQVVKIVREDPNCIIPSAKQIQERLKALDDPRYDPGPIDGIPGPRTITGWDNYIIDQHAIATFKPEYYYERRNCVTANTKQTDD